MPITLRQWSRILCGPWFSADVTLELIKKITVYMSVMNLFGPSHSLVSVLQHLNGFQRVSVGLLLQRTTAQSALSQVSWPQSSGKAPKVSVNHPSKGVAGTATTNAVYRHKGLPHMGQRSWHAVLRHWKRRVRKHYCQWLMFVLVIRPYAKTFCFVRPTTIIFDIWFQTQKTENRKVKILSIFPYLKEKKLLFWPMLSTFVFTLSLID